MEAVVLPGSPLQYHLGQVVWLLQVQQRYTLTSVLGAGQEMAAGKAVGFAG